MTVSVQTLVARVATGVNVFRVAADFESRGIVDRIEFSGENHLLPFPVSRNVMPTSIAR